MQRSTFLITATIAIGFLYFMSQTSDTISYAWRTALYKSAILRKPYEAPLLCRGPNEDLIHETYMVYLHRGCTLKEHKQTVGEKAGLDSAIKRVFEEYGAFGVCYSAKLNDSALAAVRTDIVVDMVECQYQGHINV